ncbi:MAG TPA: C40 family peptidase [Mycobacteriales bacterium]|nr:C40 family peptidase [Mycobacteriales bacterium]
MRIGRNGAALAAGAALLVVIGVVPQATADPLATAKARAAALSRTVNALRTRAEVLTERYDRVQSELNVAVSEQASADQSLTTLQVNSAQAQVELRSRAQALYESGGNTSVIASLLVGGNPAQALDNMQLANSVLTTQSRSVQAAAVTVDKAQNLDQRDTGITRRITHLQVAARTDASRVTALLARAQRSLTDATATVRRIAHAQAVAAAAAAAADFATALTTAGGTIDPNVTIKPPNNIAAMAIAAARSRLGVPYVWGATGPDAFDCSGLTQWSYAHAGISLPRTAAEQWNAGLHPSLAELEPGDLLFWALNTSDPATIHHVAMYIGNGLMIAAPHTGENVQIQPVYMDGYIGAMRPWGPVSS